MNGLGSDGGHSRRAIRKNDLAFAFVDFDFTAVLQFAEQDFVGENSFDLILNQPRHWTRAESRVIAALSKPTARAVGQLQENFSLIELLIEFDDKLVDHSLDIFLAQRVKSDHRVEPVAKFRAEHFFDRFLAFTDVRSLPETERCVAHVEAQELDPHGLGQLLGQLGLADTRRAGEEKTTDWLFWMAQS